MEDEFDALPVVPLGDKKLRACLVTGLVKTEDQVCVQQWRRALCLSVSRVLSFIGSERALLGLGV